jgi:undecaprenyl diphosphate synthase
MAEVSGVPQHVGYIVDGNRRWAKSHGLPTYEGHLAGYNVLKDMVIATADVGVKYISLYTFSTENWKRPKGEVDRLLKLMLRIFKTDLRELMDAEIRVRVLGSMDGLSNELIAAIKTAEADTAHLTRATVSVCFNYGGQQEIVEAVRALVSEGAKAEAISEETIAQHLYAPEIPPVDVVVRTSGEQRLSNFMLWRVAYSELIFLDKFWPDMTAEDVTAIINEYQRRSRRFGG